MRILTKRTLIDFYLFLFCLFGIQTLSAAEWWLEGDYLLWTTKKMPVPVPLVTSASLTDPLPGALGQPGTEILLGDHAVDLNWRNGFRIVLGGWIDGCQDLGVEANFLMLPKKRHHQSVKTSGEPGSLNVAVPIYDVTGLWGLNGVPGETVFILPGPLDGPGFQGSFILKMSSLLQGSEINSLVNLMRDRRFRLDFIGGLRWLRLQESLEFIGKTSALPNAPIASGFYNFRDSFNTNNNFYGPQIGLKADYCMKDWVFNGFAKIAFGCMHQNASLKGESQTSSGNLFYLTKDTGDELLTGGLFVEPTNRGSHRQNRFSVVVETGVNVTYLLFDCFEIGVGYNFLWLNHLFRPGEQIDRRINPTLTALAQASRDSVGTGSDTPIPFGESMPAGPATEPERPEFKHRSSNFWAQGLVVSLSYAF